MKILKTLAQYLLGAAMLFFGLNGFLQFMQPEMTEVWAPFMEFIQSVQYIAPFQNVVLLLTGLMLLANKWVPFALVILAPFTINWLLLHAFLEPSTLLMPVILVILHVFLGYVHFDSYKPMFK